MAGDERLVIIDTNVLFSSLSERSGNPATVLWLVGRARMLVSLDLLAEYRRVLHSRRATQFHGLGSLELDAVIEPIERQAVMEAPQGGPTCPDPTDQHLWDLLSAVASSVLVTGERKLLESWHFPGRVFSPRQFVERYSENGPDGGRAAT